MRDVEGYGRASRDYENMKHFQVACAIIEREGLVLAAKRSATMSLPHKWEFPGGKIDQGESPVECLRRELFEEMSVGIFVGKQLSPSTHKYESFSVTLHPFVCSIVSGEIVLHEHAAIVWLPPQKLCTLDWAEADLPVIQSYIAECEAVP